VWSLIKLLTGNAVLSSTHEFQPVSVELDGPLSDTTASFLGELGRKIDRSGDPLQDQLFNSILFHETFQDDDDSDT